MSGVPLYDDFAADYDRFVNWAARLDFELPFFRALFASHGVGSILDVACGTGHHAIAFAQEGYQVVGTDLSPAMIEQARYNAAAANVTVTFQALGFGELWPTLQHRYDAITCLGNSLPHLTTPAALHAALQDLAASLVPGGILVLQNRNFDRVLLKRERFMSPQVHREGQREWLFFRFYDFVGELLHFNVLRLHQDGAGGGWRVHLGQTEMRPWRYQELEGALYQAGLDVLQAYGSYREEPFDAQESGDLVLIARRPQVSAN